MGSICSSKKSEQDCDSVSSKECKDKYGNRLPLYKEGEDVKKGKYLVENEEFSSICEDSTSHAAPIETQAKVVKQASTATTTSDGTANELATLASLNPAVKKLLDCSLQENCPHSFLGTRTVTVYIIADIDSASEIKLLDSTVVPHLRFLACTLGFELQFTMSPIVSVYNSNKSITATDILKVSSSAVQGQTKSDTVIPVIFLNDSLGEEIVPHSLTSNDFNSIHEAIRQEEAELYLLKKWYSSKGLSIDDDGHSEEHYYLTPVQEIFLDYESRDDTLRKEARVQSKQDLEKLKVLLKQHLPDSCFKTPLEMELENILKENLLENAIWINTSWQNKSSSKSDKLESLKKNLEEKIPQSFIIESTVDEKDEERGSYLKKLSDRLCDIVNTKLKIIYNKLDNLIDSCKVIPRLLLEDLAEHQIYYKKLNSCPRKHIQHKIHQYLDGKSTSILGIRGAPGSEITSQLVEAVLEARKKNSQLITMMRTVGATSNCSTDLGAIRSLVMHLCSLYGGNHTEVSKSPQRVRQLLDDSLKPVKPSSPLLIVIDGISDERSLDYLPKTFPEHVKMIISSESVDNDIFKTLSEESGSIVEIPNLDSAEVSSMIEKSKFKRSFLKKPDSTFVENITSEMPSGVTSLQIEIATFTWQLSSSAETPKLLDSLDMQLQKYFNLLESLLGKVLVSNTMGYLSASVRGLTSSELSDLASVDSNIMKDIFSDALQPSLVERYPSSVLHHLLFCLEPILNCVVISGNSVFHVREKAVQSSITARYLKTNELKREKCETLLDYFLGKFSNGCQVQDKHSKISTDRRCLEQPLIYKSISESKATSGSPSKTTPLRCCNNPQFCDSRCRALNRRRVDEEPRLVFRSCTTTALPHMIEKYTLNHEWLVKKIHASTTRQVIEDIDEALSLCKDNQKSELELMRVALSLSEDALDYDHRQFYAQIYGRLSDHLATLPATEYSLLRSLVRTCSNSPLHSLLPTENCFVTPCMSNEELTSFTSEVFINQLSILPSNPKHVVALSTAKCLLMVWDLVERTPVRTLKGLSLPRKFEMIDDFRCLLLCGRELRIYNLDTGDLVIKFREIMNQKMPFFGLNRPENVVALARSRMYVNMMTISNGECVATFKVGEDRFLNSLTVSKNGRICVCGDDTQRVSALLVWDLNQRKLLYDLRIPHHEFLTKFVAITSEGHYVACVCRETEENAPNFLVVYDLGSGTLFKRWKPDCSSTALAISTPGVSVVAALEDATITAYDLVTGNPRWCVRGHSYPADTIKLDPNGSFVVTYDSTGHDRAIRVWDMHSGMSISVWTPDSPITSCEVSSDSRSVVVSLVGRSDLVTLVIVHKDLPSLEDFKGDSGDFAYGDIKNLGVEFDA